MHSTKVLIVFSSLFLLTISAGCGGGGASVDSQTGAGATMAFTWDAPTTHLDGSGLSDLAGYKIYCGTASGSNNYTELAQIPLGALTCNTVSASTTECTYDIQGINPGTYYCAMTSYTTAGFESDFSNEVVKKIE